MKITVKQLRKIIKEELENAMLGSEVPNDNIDIEWGKYEVDEDDNSITYEVIITHDDIKIKTSVRYDGDLEPNCLMVEEGDFFQLEGEEISEELLQKLENAIIKEASTKDCVQGAKDDIDNYYYDKRDSEDLARDPDAYYGVKGQFYPKTKSRY